MQKPRVSIIVTTKNEEEVIGRLLKSIKNQTYQNIEMVVVDNGSIDATRTISKKYTKKVYIYGPERSAQYWLRDSHIIQVSNGRYLIIPAVGTALFIGALVGLAKRKTPIIFLVTILLLVHMYASHKYVSHLSTVRGISVTSEIRDTIPNVFTKDKLDNPIVFYFEPRNSEILHHSLLFGFPVIMATQYDFMNIFNIVYTDNWAEVVSAYIDGEGVRRFGAKVEPVALENIYSYRLDGITLIETTDQTRSRLNELLQNSQ